MNTLYTIRQNNTSNVDKASAARGVFRWSANYLQEDGTTWGAGVSALLFTADEVETNKDYAAQVGGSWVATFVAVEVASQA